MQSATGRLRLNLQEQCCAEQSGAGGRKAAGGKAAGELLQLRCREDGNCLTTELHARFLPLPARSSSVHGPAPLLRRAAGPGHGQMV